jgi:hypothetical protein
MARGRSGRIVVVVALTVLVAILVFLARRPILQLLEDPPLDPAQQSTATEKKADIPVATEDFKPSFEPLALRTMVETKLKDGIRPTVDAYLVWVSANIDRIKSHQDYSMTFLKRERVEGKVWPQERMSVKVRTEPLSYYMLFHEPSNLKGQEVIWVDGKNGGRIVGHTGGILGVLTLRIAPNSPRAMQGNRHPIMNTGLVHMLNEVITNIPVDIERNNSTFAFHLKEKVGERECTCFEVRRTKVDPGDKDPKFQGDKMYIDDETHNPIYYLRYEWPEKEGDEPVQVEEYSHLDVKFDNGFTGVDFDEKNPQYNY